MNNNDQDAAYQALLSWFESQDIAPCDAALIMCDMLNAIFRQLKEDDKKAKFLEAVTTIVGDDDDNAAPR